MAETTPHRRRRAAVAAGRPAGANHSLYLRHATWAQVQAIARRLGWSDSHAVDELIAFCLAPDSHRSSILFAAIAAEVAARQTGSEPVEA